MDVARKAGFGSVFGVPAIVGSGLVWEITENWYAVFGYLALLVVCLGGFLIRK